jgi:hypothetical protein
MFWVSILVDIRLLASFAYSCNYTTTGCRKSGFRIKEIEDRRQKTGDRRQKTGDRRQKTEDRRQKTEDRRPTLLIDISELLT